MGSAQVFMTRARMRGCTALRVAVETESGGQADAGPGDRLISLRPPAWDWGTQPPAAESKRPARATASGDDYKG
jgi:hypothetical protein